MSLIVTRPSTFSSKWCQEIGTLVLIIVGGLLLIGCSPPEYSRLQGQTMGTYYALQANPSGQCQIDEQAVIAELALVNNHMSTYQLDSELSQLNASSNLTWTPISEPLVEVMTVAQELWRRSDGAFDVTVGPLVNLWGFGPGTGSGQSEDQARPNDSAQQRAAARVGMAKLQLEGSALRKSIGDLYIDLSALAKGYGVDRLANLLIEQGCDDFMVDIGGEIRTAGRSPKGQAWRIGIEVPDPAQIGTLQTVLSLTNMSIATSGDYRNYRVIDGRRIDHVLDPRNGQPADNAVVSATVLHASAMWADAYATTLMVLGSDAGIAFAEAEGIAAYIMTKHLDERGEERLEARHTANMAEYLPASKSAPP